MSSAAIETNLVLGPDSAGILMTTAEFDAVTEYDENYRYELIHGVLVVNPIPGPEETGPNELLAHLLWDYQQRHPQGAILDESLTQQYVRSAPGRRIADQLIWTGQRTLTVVTDSATGSTESRIAEGSTYESPILPGFVVPVGRILAAADRRAQR